MTTRILAIEDDPGDAALIRVALEASSCQCIVAAGAKQGLALAAGRPFDLILLDRMLPGMDDLDVLRALKEDPKTALIPVVLVTGKDAEADIVAGLEMGADDYLTKPFSAKVLMARVRAVLRRAGQDGAPPEDAVLEAGALRMDVGKHLVTVSGKDVSLTLTEFKLLHALLKRSGHVLARPQLLDAVWGAHSPATDRLVDVHLFNLRRKLGRLGERVEAVRGLGYRWGE